MSNRGWKTGGTRKTAQATFAASLKHHAMMEEQIMYPAAILVGEYLKKK